MGAAHPVRGHEGCHCRELNVFHHDIEIFGLDPGLQNAVHLNDPLLHNSPFAHGAVKKRGSLIKFFNYRNRAMDARAGEFTPAGSTGMVTPWENDFSSMEPRRVGIMQLPIIGEPFSSSSHRCAGVDM